MPALRVEFRSAKNIEAVTQEILTLSRKKGWRMVPVTGTPEQRYQSTNGKKFDLLWAVERAGRTRGSNDRMETIYHLFYWKIYGD
jgi:hypothetical protein